MSLPSWSDSQVNRQLDSGSSWSDPIITYAFPNVVGGIDTSGGEGTAFVPLNANQRAIATLSLALWDNLIFNGISRVVSGLSDVEFGMSRTGVDYAHAYYPNVGSVWFNLNNEELVSPIVGEYGFSTYIHEIGHALGLDHAGDYNGTGNWTPSYFQDSTVYTIMSYFGPDRETGQNQVAWGDWTAVNGITYSAQTPMLNDVMAIQAMYGADTTTRTGDTIYGFSSNISQNGLDAVYDFSLNAHPILCIYDASGVDTLNLSGWHTTSNINLSGGTLSSCNSMTNNLSIARNTLIENLITGSGDDILQGNIAENRLDGGLGLDTVLYAHSIHDYAFRRTGNDLVVEDSIINRDALDNLLNIERLEFSDWQGSIQEKTASEQMAVLNLAGQLSEYWVSGNIEAAVIVDYHENRGGLQLISDYQRLEFTDFNIGLDSGAGEKAGMAYRLYKAAFDRVPDLGGVGYWIHRMDNGLSLQSTANEFISSPEFAKLYGTNPSDSAFVTLLYEHVMHRAADGEGFNFWVNALAPNGGWTRPEVLAYFSESPENLDQTATLVANGIQYVEYVA